MTSQTDSHLLVSRIVRTSPEIQCTFSHRKTESLSMKFYIHKIDYKFYHIMCKTKKTNFCLAPRFNNMHKLYYRSLRIFSQCNSNEGLDSKYHNVLIKQTKEFSS